MKYIIGFLVAIVLFISGLLVRPVLAEWVQPMAWQQKISTGSGTPDIYRVEWFSDVCYFSQYGYTTIGTSISCVKK